MSTFTEKKIGIFGDSHVQSLQLPENVVALGKGGERARNWRNYTNELRGYDVLVIMIGGNDICPRDIFTPADMSLKELTAEIRDLFSYCQQNNTVVLTADIIPRLNNPDGIRKMNSRLLNKYKRKHIELAEAIGRDFSDGVHLSSYEFLRQYLIKKIKLLAENVN